ncbi:hypothetical protein GmHk_03G006762 [Glycine max]|nr:hypothetical protein GmHk_03G006762 [Glycine max]
MNLNEYLQIPCLDSRRAYGSRQIDPKFRGVELIGMLIRQVCEVLIFTLSLSQYAGLASHPLSATLLG